MSASDHIQPKLFHGTAHYFGEDGLIDPAFNKQNFFELNMIKGTKDWHGPTTYATSSLDRAKSMASRKARDNDMLFAPVYEVPSEKFTSFGDIHPSLKPVSEGGLSENADYVDNYVTKEKVKPIRIAGWGINPNAANDDSAIPDKFYARKQP